MHERAWALSCRQASRPFRFRYSHSFPVQESVIALRRALCEQICYEGKLKKLKSACVVGNRQLVFYTHRSDQLHATIAHLHFTSPSRRGILCLRRQRSIATSQQPTIHPHYAYDATPSPPRDHTTPVPIALSHRGRLFRCARVPSAHSHVCR